MHGIDFTNLPQKNKAYAGANGNKLSVVYKDELYMLKFPAHAKRNDNMSYTNGCFSEYLGSRIFNSVGISAQHTELGIFNVNGVEKIVVACKDFTKPGIVLQDFASLKNKIIDSKHNGYGTELLDVLHTIKSQSIIDPSTLEDWFWDMFIVDALIGNWDRHNGNWGFLYDTYSDNVELAPIYDCGSCLYPQADDLIMEKCISTQAERDLRTYEIPTSALLLNGSKIKYFDFISAGINESCNNALKRIHPRIDMEKIRGIIEDTPFISDLQKNFYWTMLCTRKEKILDFSFEKITHQSLDDKIKGAKEKVFRYNAQRDSKAGKDQPQR